MFCKHKWTEKERFYTGGTSSFKGRVDDDQDIERILFGVTSILYLCEKCGKHRVIEVKGKSLT
jgi:hypothetical protein